MRPVGHVVARRDGRGWPRNKGQPDRSQQQPSAGLGARLFDLNPTVEPTTTGVYSSAATSGSGMISSLIGWTQNIFLPLAVSWSAFLSASLRLP